MTAETRPDPLAYGPTGYRCGCGKDAHSNLTPCQPGLDDNELLRLQARVAELERPAVEAKRNKIRDSFAELAAAAREDRDFEGAFNVECDLRKREEQWAAEDAAVSAAGESGSTR